jgi:hypothetical protein
VKSLDDVERYLGVPVLAVIPKDVGILHKQSGLSPDAEAYRILRTNIEFNRRSADANAITIVSGGAGEGNPPPWSTSPTSALRAAIIRS